MEHDTASNTQFKVFYLELQQETTVKEVAGGMSNVCIFGNKLVYVEGFRVIKLADIELDEWGTVVGEHDSDIVAICPVIVKYEESSRGEDIRLILSEIVVSVDRGGVLIVWRERRRMEVIQLGKLPVLSVDSGSRLFFLGYPYLVKANPPYISVSTDLGIFVLKSKYFGDKTSL